MNDKIVMIISGLVAFSVFIYLLLSDAVDRWLPFDMVIKKKREGNALIIGHLLADNSLSAAEKQKRVALVREMLQSGLDKLKPAT